MATTCTTSPTPTSGVSCWKRKVGVRRNPWNRSNGRRLAEQYNELPPHAAPAPGSSPLTLRLRNLQNAFNAKPEAWVRYQPFHLRRTPMTPRRRSKLRQTWVPPTRPPASRRDSWEIVTMFHGEHLWWQYCTYINVRELAASESSEAGYGAFWVLRDCRSWARDRVRRPAPSNSRAFSFLVPSPHG